LEKQEWNKYLLWASYSPEPAEGQRIFDTGILDFKPLSGYIGSVANLEQEQRIGIWQVGEIIFRRDSLQEPFPRTYVPKKPEDFLRVMELVELLQDGASMSAWTPEVEDHQNELFEELGKLTR